MKTPTFRTTFPPIDSARIVLKVLAAFLILAAYSVTSCAIRMLPADEKKRVLRLTGNLSRFSRLALRLLGIRLTTAHERDHRTEGSRGRLVVANHLSYVDILIISSVMPSVFVTSMELKHTFLLGALARFGGSLFVERRSPAGLKPEIEAISRVLAQGFNVVLFPEGTTSNGERVQQFKISLFDAAIKSTASVLPLCLRYRTVNRETITARNRDMIFYYGGMAFCRHIPRLLSLKSVEADLIFLRSIPVHAHLSRKDLAARAHHAIVAAYAG